MTVFHYKARDSRGKLVTGKSDANSADAVASELFGKNITPIEIQEVKASKKAANDKSAAPKSTAKKTKSSAPSTIDNINAFLAGSKVEVDDVIMFSRQMFSLTKAGMPLDRALKGLEASISNATFKKVLRDVIRSLESGITLAGALGKHPKIFSPLYLSLVTVGENTGQLDGAFREIGKYLALEKTTAKQMKSATRYPIFVLIAITIALGILTYFVIPVFAETFDRLGADLPLATRILITSSDFVINYWPIILLSIGGGIAGFRSWVSTPLGKRSWDKRKLGFPIIGGVFERIALGRFARTFSMVMGAGVPIVQGLSIVADAVGNAHISRNVLKMRDSISRGETLYNTAVASDMFTPLVLQMISVGEESGTIDELLAEVADFYETEIEYDVKQLGDAIEPILIMFIAGLVLILALGVFLPIWDLGTAAGG